MVAVRRAERYTIGQGVEGTVITMCQNREALAFAALTGTGFFACLWFGPGVIPSFEGSFYWICCALLGAFALAGIVGAMYRERWVITDSEIIATDTFGMKRRRIPREGRLRLHLDASGAAVGGALFSYEVEIEDRNGQSLVPGFSFSTSVGAGDFIEALRCLLPVDIDMPKSHGPLRSDPNDS